MRERAPNTLPILYKAFGRYRWQIAGLVVLGFFSGLFESVSVGAVIPLFSILVGDQGGQSNFITSFIVGIFKYLPFPLNPVSLLSIIVGFFFAKALVLFLFSYVRAQIITDYKRETTKNLFSGVLHARWSFLLKQRLGHLQNTFIKNIDHGSSLLMIIGNVILACTSFLMYFFVAINISPFITLSTLVGGAALMVILRPLVKKAKTIAQQVNSVEKENTQHISEHIIGIKTIKAAAVEEMAIFKEVGYLDILRSFALKSTTIRFLSAGFIQPLSFTFIAVVFAFYYKSPGFNLAAFLATLYLIEKIFVNVDSLQRSLHSVSEFTPYAADTLRLNESLEENIEKNTQGLPFGFSKLIEGKNIQLEYLPGKPVLRGVNITIHKGETVGVIGPSGAGKTSLVDIFLRLFTPTDGHIYIDGVDYETINLHEWRSRVGYVSQDLFLLNDTIENNIRFYNSELTDNEIIIASKQANIYDFVVSLENGFKTYVGDRGIMLSAGQRQRVALARELANKPEILVLDEATSALDNESEVLIQQSLKELRGKITVLIIAHRLSTIIDVDRLFVIDKGVVVESGLPQELLENKNSYFYRVYHLKDEHMLS